MNHEANIEGQIICGFAKTITKYSYANKRVLLNTSLCTDVPYSSKKISPRIFFWGEGGAGWQGASVHRLLNTTKLTHKPNSNM